MALSMGSRQRLSTQLSVKRWPQPRTVWLEHSEAGAQRGWGTARLGLSQAKCLFHFFSSYPYLSQRANTVMLMKADPQSLWKVTS